MSNSFNNPIPKDNYAKKTHEGSPLRSPRDRDSVGTQWKQIGNAQKNVQALTSNVQQIQRQLARLRRRGGGTSGSSSGTDPVWL